MPKYSIVYEESIQREAVVEAKNVKEAVEKVTEVVGDVDIVQSWEIYGSTKDN